MAVGSVIQADPSVANSVAKHGFAQRLARVLEESKGLSEQHRMSLPPAAVYRRVHELCDAVRPMFQDWTLEICFLLDHHGVLRYGHLKRQMGGISTRTLAAKLVQLQEWGLVHRTSYDAVPPHVEYRLTDHGRAFTALVLPIFAHLVPRPSPGSSEEA